MNSFRNSDPRPPIMTGSPPSMIVPRMHWDRGPWNRWAFQHVREIVPTVEVWRGHGHRSRLAEQPVDLDDLAFETEAGPTTLARHLDDSYTDGFLVLHDGKVVCERYFNGMTPRTLHLSQSMAKSVTAVTFAALEAQGLISAQSRVTDVLPELERTGWRGATLQQVLDMTTGVRFSEAYTDPCSDIGRVDVATGWKPVPPGADPDFRWPSHMWELILDLAETTRPHGERFEYRSIETDVLAFAMERATGKRLATLVSEELWQKIGPDESACFTVDPAGYAVADGGFNATLRDYARFGQFVLEGGRGLLPEGWVEATRTSPVHGPSFSASMPEGSYRNQFWIEDPQSRSLMCRGVFGQLIHIDFERATVIVKLSSWPDFTDVALSRATLRAVRAIGHRLTAA